jgi:hypothetical protein
MIAFSAGAARLRPPFVGLYSGEVCRYTGQVARAKLSTGSCSTTCASRATFSRAPIGGTDIDPDTITGTILYASSILMGVRSANTGSVHSPRPRTPDPVWAPMCGRGLFIR